MLSLLFRAIRSYFDSGTVSLAPLILQFLFGDIARLTSLGDVVSRRAKLSKVGYVSRWVGGRIDVSATHTIASIYPFALNGFRYGRNSIRSTAHVGLSRTISNITVSVCLHLLIWWRDIRLLERLSYFQNRFAFK